MPNNDDEDQSYSKIKRETTFQNVRNIFESQITDKVDQMEKIGFTWVDDDYGQEEELEEKRAKPESLQQEYLIAYLNGHLALDFNVLEAFLLEKNAEKPNFPLFRKYFKQGNRYLKDLILFGLCQNPVDPDLLSDLSFFNEFEPILPVVIESYLKACLEEDDLTQLELLITDFYRATIAYDFDSFYELEQMFATETAKRKIVEKIKKREEEFSHKGFSF